VLEVGQVTKPHGLKGEVIVKLITNHPQRAAAGSVLASERGPMRILRSSPHQHGWIVCFEGVSTREQAEDLRGLTLSAEPLEVPGELWIHELIGAEVFDVDGRRLGRCVAVEDNPASDLIVLDDGGLVPLHFVVDHRPGRITVDPPAGLFEL
jgi:16S rRNA processing protein RimM